MEQPSFTLLAGGMSFLESPRWHDGRLWLSDFYTRRVIAVDPAGQVETIAQLDDQPSGLGWLPDGRLLVVSMRDRKLLRREPDGRFVTHAELASVAGGHCNDMVVDAQGRAWVGNFGFDLMGGAPPERARLARVDADGSVTAVADDLCFPNGAVITPDGGTLIVGESFGNRISAFEILPDGRLGPRRDWARFGDPPQPADLMGTIGQLAIAPDGCTLDAEGCLWVADAIGQRVVRVREGQGIVEQIRTSPMGVFACALGGADGRTLFLCVAPDFDEHARSAAREAQLWTLRVDVPHAGRP